jgi:hypothetical protein
MGMPGGITKERRAFEEEYFGGMWLADTCYFPYIAESGKKRRTYLIAIIDDHSRMCVGAGLFNADNAFNFQIVLKRAVSAYGIPTKLYDDHGSSYQNSQLRFIAAEIGTILIHAPVRDGAAKGKIERMFRTFKERWLYGFDTNSIHSLEEFNDSLMEYVRAHNLIVSSSTGKTPMERFLMTRDRIIQPKSQEWLDECFMNRVRRKVRNDSTVSIDSISFDTPMQFIRQTVEVRFLPGHMDEAYIFDNGTKYPLKLTNKVSNGKAKRKSITVDYSKGGNSDV